MSRWAQYLHALGLGEGRGQASVRDGLDAAPVAMPSPGPGSGRFGTPAQTEWERQALARLAGPVPVAVLDRDREPVYAGSIGMGARDDSDGAPFGGAPPLSIRSAARPGIMLSSFVPPSGPPAAP